MAMTGEMPPLGRGDAPSPDDVRASHEDRERVVDVLRVAAGDGRLTAEELDERLESALTARTYGELAVVIKDLPAAPGFVMGGPAPVPKELAHIDCQSSNAIRAGRWLVPRRMELLITSGNVTLDFTDAVISQPLLLIDAHIRSSQLRLVTKPGIVVDTDEVATDSSVLKVRPPSGPDVPVILRVQLSGQASMSVITVGPPRAPRRTFWQWLRRRQRPYALAPP
jgi:hypothetical protein